MQKILFSFLIGAVFSGILVAIAVGGISETNFTKRINTISKQLDDSRSTNRRLIEANNLLIINNREVTNRVGELKEQITRDNRRHQEELTGIRNTLGNVAQGLATSKGTIRDVIQGIEGIKQIVQSLPID